MVQAIHANIDWRRFPKKRTCFFVDRDLSSLIPEKLAQDVNIYVTDGYSIENDIVNKRTCRRVLTEVCGFGKIDHGEIDQVCDVFERELEGFLREMIPIMAWILFWRRNGKRASLNDILMRDLFLIVSGCLQTKATPKGKADMGEYIHGQCNVAYDQKLDTSIYEAEFRSRDVYRKFTRGKYVFWFLVEFCLSVRKSAKTLFKSCTNVPSMNVTLSASNGMTVIGHRARIPNSLSIFLNNTFCQYIDAKVA